MSVLELLAEIQDIIDTAPGLPLSDKVMVDGGDILEIVREIRLALPDDIEQAKWVKDNKQQILNKAKEDYESIINEAKKEADYLVAKDEITKEAHKQANELIKSTEDHTAQLKMGTYEYVDRILFDMQEKMDELNLKYFGEMYSNLEKSFDTINNILSTNREEIKQLAINVKNDYAGKRDYSDKKEEE